MSRERNEDRETMLPPMTSEPDNGSPAPKRGRGPAKRQRRNYATECAALQARIDMAVRILRKATNSAAISADLVNASLEILSGDD
jgi:hypothetical protein